MGVFAVQIKKSKYLVVISLDALNAKDLDIIKGLPNFKSYFEKASYAKRVRSIYPSLTYPCHVSIVTGVYPDKHGVYSNEFNQPGVHEQEWFWYSSYIKVPTLYDLAKKNQMRVGSLFWPVMGKARIDYNITEIFPTKKRESLILKVLKASTPIFALGSFFRYGKLLNGKKQPNLDNFTAKTAEYLIKKKKPNLSLIHLTDLDSFRHMYGTFSKESEKALLRADERIGEIVKSAKEAGIYEDTTFVILGDHGFLDVKYRINLNTAFRKEGLLEVDEEGQLLSWQAYCNYCDGSAQIYLKNREDKALKKKVCSILKALAQDESNGIEKIYTREEFLKKRIDGPFDFMVEAKEGYYFSKDWDKEELVTLIDAKDLTKSEGERHVATHGYDPMKPNYNTFFMAFGASIKEGVVLEEINLVDIGPTLGKILGINLQNTDGRVIKDILKT